jgi:hypothetical protein
MENFDFFKILGYGLTGLACILALLTFTLLKTEQGRQAEVRPEMLSSIRSYMYTTLAMIVLVGGFSLPVLQKNSVLIQENQTLSSEKKTNDSTVIVNLYKKASELEQKLIDAQTNSQKIPQVIQNEAAENKQKVSELKTQIIDLNKNGITTSSLNNVIQSIDTLEATTRRYDIIKMSKTAFMNLKVQAN